MPDFSRPVKRWNWPFDDPSTLAGSREEILTRARQIRDEIKARIQAFIREYDEKGLKLFID